MDPDDSSPVTPLDLRHGATTDVGLVRETNQDSLLAQPPVFAVADGMGGHAGGEVASRIAVEELAALGAGPWDPRSGTEAVVACLARAQTRIVDYGQAQRGTHRRWASGTTVVVALPVEDAGEPAWLVVNLGDSRAYGLGPEGMRQVSVDHSVVQELVAAGRISPEQAAEHPERHVLTRALGSPGGAQPDAFTVPMAAAPRMMLCSDGVNGMLTDQAIADVLGAHDDPEEAARALVRAAVEAGGVDNATAVVVDAVGRPPGT